MVKNCTDKQGSISVYNCCLSEWSKYDSLLVNSIQVCITYTIKLDISCTMKKNIYDRELQCEKNNMCLGSSLRKIKEELSSKAFPATTCLFSGCYQKCQFSKSGSSTEENISVNSTLKKTTHTHTLNLFLFSFKFTLSAPWPSRNPAASDNLSSWLWYRYPCLKGFKKTSWKILIQL